MPLLSSNIMASHGFSTGSSYSMEQVNVDEARRRQLKKLRARMRFRNKFTNNDTVAENCNNNNNSVKRRESQTSSISFLSAKNQTEQQQEAILSASKCQVNQLLNSNPFYRRFSTASFHSYQPQYHIPFYCMPHAGNAFPHLRHPPEPTLSNGLLQNSQRNCDDEDNDDVFESAAPLSVPSQPNISNQVQIAVPCSPVSLQQLQSRKRAHSAGDMIGLCVPASPHVVYPQSIVHSSETPDTKNITVRNANNILPVHLKHPTNTPYDHSMPPHKRFAPDVIDSSVAQANPHSMSRNLMTVLGHSQIMRVKQKEAVRLNDPPLPLGGSNSRKVAVPAAEYAASSTQHPQAKDTNRIDKVTRHYKSASAIKPIQTGSKITRRLQVQPTALKSSFSTKSLPVKKKVVWNDLAQVNKSPSQGTPQTVPSVIVDESLKNVDIGLVKANPSAFTTKNKIGQYLIGPKLGSCPVKSISQYLVRKSNTNKYYMAKILSMDEKEVKNGKMLLHTEHSLLSLLSFHVGVIKQHGMFKDCSYDITTGKISPRVGLILDCLAPHEYNSTTRSYLNLQQYVIQMKRLGEREAIRLFYSIVSIVHSLHQSNVVHRDLKLGNIVLDKRTRKVTLTNFCLGCHLTSERHFLTDQRGSPAYISPDVLSDKPYAGKPSDMWSLGVILFTMLYGQFPFYDQEPKKLFSKIKAVDYTIPANGQVSANTNDVIRGLLTLDPKKRLTAHDALASLETCAVMCNAPRRLSSACVQVVPDIDNAKPIKVSKSQQETESSEDELTRAFYMRMPSDDESDVSTNPLKGTRKTKRATVEKLLSARVNNFIVSTDCYQAQQLRQIRVNNP